MDTRPLAALVSSLVSQALLLVLLLTQSNPDLLLVFTSLPRTGPLLPHLLHLAAASSSLVSRCRKRSRDAEEEEEVESPLLLEGSTPCVALDPHPNPDHFKLLFGMRSSTFEWLAGLLDPLMDSRDPTGSPFRLPTTARLALALARLATGACYADLAARFSVSEPAARFCARHLSRVLCTNFRFWLAFPTSPDHLRAVSTGFISLAGLPGCCGALVSTRFHLRHGPAAAFLVADASSKILTMAAFFRGDRRGIEVLKASSLYKEAEKGRLLGPEQYLIGDESHHLCRWLMVPFAAPVPGSCEEDFNAAVRAMCWPARRALASLQKWRVLSRLSEEETTKVAMAFIGTCAILHNVLLMREDDSALEESGEEWLLSSEKCREEEEEETSEKKAVFLRSSLATKAMAMRKAAGLVSAH